MAEYIHFGITDNRTTLEAAMRHSVSAGGKRLRPLLALATFQLFDTDISRIMPLACAIELLHTYSLIHDDLPSMDNDSLRRGLPTCHVKYGEDIAILAGDTLNTYSFELLATHLSTFPPAQVLKVIAQFAVACGINGMSGGQVLDLKGVAERDNVEYLVKTHALKTGALISASIVLPAILTSATPTQLTILEKFGNEIGLLFQIGDDILDVIGDQGTMGKTLNKDADQNKLTYIRVYGLPGTQALLKTHAQQARETLRDLNLPTTSLLESIVDYIETRIS
jgi:geranylgeranyl diphosphate synthase type II